MGYKTVKKPGYMLRACVGWVILNLVLLFTLAATVYIVQGYLDRWYVIGTLLIIVMVSEIGIMNETIAPILTDWIKQEETVDDGQKPTWQK